MSLDTGDLMNTVDDEITIDEYEPKSGTSKELIVVGFYCVDKEPAKDLNRFIQRGTSKVVDAEVSPNPNVEGKFIVFVEFKRNEDFAKNLCYLTRDVENLTGPMDWKIKPYLSDDAFPIDDEKKFKKYVIVDPGSIKDKKEFKEARSMEHKIIPYLKDSFLSDLIVEDKCVIFTHTNRRVAAKIVDFGNHADLLDYHNLNESAIAMFDIPTEIGMLSSLLGEGWDVSKVGGFAIISNAWNNKILLLKEVQIVPNGYTL